MTNWKLPQFSGNGSFDHDTNNREAALVLVLPRPEEGKPAPSSVRQLCSAKGASLRAAISMSSRATLLVRSNKRR